MTALSDVPFVDLGLQHRRIAEDVKQGFDRVLAKTSFVLGPEVERFEAEFAAYCNVRHAIGVANGTDALELALRAGRVGHGDEVIVPANTFVATAEAVVRAGATVVLADCDEDFLLDPLEVSKRTSSATRAVAAVHLYGQTAPVEVIRDAAGDGVILLEDGAQSQGARRFDVAAGALGDIAATSFYPGKNLGAYGDAGAIMTSSAEFAERAVLLRNHGGVKKYEHLEVGMNSRLDGLQAVVLSTKLALLDEWNAERRAAAAHYGELLAGNERVITPRTLPGNEHVFHLYVVRVPERARVLAALQDAGIGAGIHYPTPVHLLPAFAFLGYEAGDFPVAEQLAGEILSLPIFPGITAEQQERVAQALLSALA